MAKTVFNLPFNSDSELQDSTLIGSQGNGTKQRGFVDNSNDPALNVRLAEGEYRSEIGLRAYRVFDVGGHYTAEWKMYVPDDFSRPQASNDWGTIVQQWGPRINSKVKKLENPSTSYMILSNDGNLSYRPAVYLGEENGKYLMSHKRFDLGKVEKNQWIEFKQEIIPRSDEGGLLKMWKDGELVVDSKGPLIMPEDGHDNILGTWKVGAYTQRQNNGTRSLWYDDIVIKELETGEQVQVAPDSGSDSGSDSSSNPESIDISGMPVEIWRQAEGTKVTESFELQSLDGLNSPKLEISAFDIDDAAEAKLYLNGTEVALPSEIVRLNGGTLSGSVDVDKNMLVQGNNTVTWEFASNLNNSTQGYAVKTMSLTLA